MVGSRDPDVVVVGSGPNGMSAACVLARAGLQVLVVEAHPQRLGGALGSDEGTLPGFIHDVGAAFFPFGQLSPALLDLDLTAHGVQWKHCEFESCHPAPDGTYACISRDAAVSERHFGNPVDGAAWRELAQWHARVEKRFLGALLRPFPPVMPALKLLPFHLLKLTRLLAQSQRSLATGLFQSEPARRVFPGLALHVDVGPDDTFGAGIGYVLGMTASTGGYAVPVGGARSITAAFHNVLTQHGGSVKLGARVGRVLVRDGAAVGVRLDDGTEIAARRGVFCDTAAPSLYLELVEPAYIPSWVMGQMKRFPRSFGTFKMDWALSGPVPWKVEQARHSAVVHAGDSVDDLARFAAEVRAGQLPEHPYLVIGQQSLADATRAPEGCHTLWTYSRVPSEIEGGWDAHSERFADRIEARIEGLAPGFKALIKARRIVSPDGLQAMDANLVGGDIGGGSNAWYRQLIFRPVFPYFRYKTPVPRLYLCSSYAHPGAGVHGMCGYNAAHVAMPELV